MLNEQCVGATPLSVSKKGAVIRCLQEESPTVHAVLAVRYASKSARNVPKTQNLRYIIGTLDKPPLCRTKTVKITKDTNGW